MSDNWIRELGELAEREFVDPSSLDKRERDRLYLLEQMVGLSDPDEVLSQSLHEMGDVLNAAVAPSPAGTSRASHQKESVSITYRTLAEHDRGLEEFLEDAKERGVEGVTLADTQLVKKSSPFADYEVFRLKGDMVELIGHDDLNLVIFRDEQDERGVILDSHRQDEWHQSVCKDWTLCMGTNARHRDRIELHKKA